MQGATGIVLGMRSFGMSAPIAVAAEHFGFTIERVVEAAKQTMAAADSFQRNARRPNDHEPRSKTMQLGMIGLGRMGGNMVTRLGKAGHECLVYDTPPGGCRCTGR